MCQQFLIEESKPQFTQKLANSWHSQLIAIDFAFNVCIQILSQAPQFGLIHHRIKSCDIFTGLTRKHFIIQLTTEKSTTKVQCAWCKVRIGLIWQRTIYVLFTKLASWTVPTLESSILCHVEVVASNGSMHTRAAPDYSC